MVRRARGLKHVAPRTGAGINQRRVAQFLPGEEIDFAPFALDVSRKRSADVRSFIPPQSKPVKVFDDGVAKFCRTPIAVEIFNPQNQSSTVLIRTFLRAPERHRMPDMKITPRRWGNAAAVSCHSERSRGISHCPRICMNRAIPRLRFAFAKLRSE